VSIEVPAGWEVCPLDDVARLVRGITFPTDVKRHEPQEGHVACLRTANVQFQVEWDDLWYVPRKYVKNQDQYVRTGDVLISTANSYELVGKVAQINSPRIEASLGAFISLLRSEPGVNASYFYYLLSSDSIQRAIREKASTTTNLSNVSGAKLKQLQLPIAPSAEQIRIVEKLEELLSDLDAGVAELKTAQQKLQRYRQSLLKAAVEGALTAEWRQKNPPTETGAELLQRILRERRARWEEQQLAKFTASGKAPPKGWKDKYPEPQPPKTEGLPELPGGWVWATLGQCFRVAVGATPSRQEPSYWDGDIPWVSSGEVRFQRVQVTKETITAAGLANSSTQLNPRGSVLLGMIGEGKTRGQVAILDIEAANNQNCAAIWVTETEMPPEFVYAWLWSRYEETRRGSSGNNQPALNKALVERMLMPLPPLNEARESVRCLQDFMDRVSELERLVERSLRQSSIQRQNILRAAFRGELVPQEPNDERASVLLERLRAERGGAVQSPRKSRKKTREETSA
jgi:type I restriction enzyme S subunit